MKNILLAAMLSVTLASGSDARTIRVERNMGGFYSDMRLEHGEQVAGAHGVVWQGTDDVGRRLSSGVYFARFVVGSVSESQRLVLVK